jgi:predicted dehydrogenase
MPLRFALIGLGQHGRNAVAPAFYHPQVRASLRAVCDVRPQALDAFDLPVENRTADYRETLRDGAVDAVYVAAGMDRHFRIAMDCLEAGKHVLVEKPMAASTEECRRMTDEARARNLLLAVNFESRYGEQNGILRRWIADGRFGRLEALHFSNLWDGHKREGPIRERRARLMALSGALDCGIHKLDQARFLAGGTWRRIEAVGAWLGEDEFVPPAHIGILGQLDNGVAVTLNSSLAWGANIKPRPMVNTLEIAGTRGVALCRSTSDLRRMTLQLFSQSLEEEIEIDATGHTEDIVMVLNDFERVVREGPAASDRLATGEDGTWAQFAMETANACASRTKIPVAGAP